MLILSLSKKEKKERKKAYATEQGEFKSPISSRYISKFGKEWQLLIKADGSKHKKVQRSGIALQGIDREGRKILEACDTTKAQSKAIAKQNTSCIHKSNTFGVLKYHPPHRQQRNRKKFATSSGGPLEK